MRPGSEIAQPKTQKVTRSAVRTVSKEEAELKLINRPKAKDVTPLTYVISILFLLKFFLVV